MEQYISKDALAAEIKRLIKHSEMVADHNTQITELVSRELDALYHLISFLDTLEVKEVDLEKEISNYLDNHNLNIQDGGRIVFNNGDTPNFLCDFRDIAKHFFELGLKAQKGE